MKLKKIIAMTAVAVMCIVTARPLPAAAESTTEEDMVMTAAVPTGCQDGVHLLGREVYQYTTEVPAGTHTVTVTDAETGVSRQVTCYISNVVEVYLVTCECGQSNGGTVSHKIDTIHSAALCPDQP